ncbi:MAG: hypothetical protein ACE5JX_14685 [Acidobacteriota bacterium]
MNRGELRSQILEDLGEPSSTYWSPADVNDAIQAAHEDIAERTSWFEAVYSGVTIPASTRHYDASTLIPTPLFIRRIWVPARNQWLERKTALALDAEDRWWEQSNGPADHFMVRGMWHLGFHPLDTSSWTCDIYAQALPSALENDSDEPGFPDEFHRLLVDFAIYDLQIQRGKLAQGLQSFEEYSGGLLRFKDWVRRRNQARNYYGPYRY